LELSGLDIPRADLEKLLEVDVEGWWRETDGIAAFYDQFGGRFPDALRRELEALRSRLS
jgi:phosphoenolpyruvate carboxykinase (GTP)